LDGPYIIGPIQCCGYSCGGGGALDGAAEWLPGKRLDIGRHGVPSISEGLLVKQTKWSGICCLLPNFRRHRQRVSRKKNPHSSGGNYYKSLRQTAHMQVVVERERVKVLYTL